MSFITTILLQAAPAPEAAKGSPNGMLMNVLFIGLMIAVFYFFMIRPQKKKQDEQAKFIDTLKKGDKVATIGGAVGKVVEVRTKTFIIENEAGVRLQFLRSAISFDNTKVLNSEVADDKKD
jgi:preprotein translocase subunit YajC